MTSRLLQQMLAEGDGDGFRAVGGDAWGHRATGTTDVSHVNFGVEVTIPAYKLWRSGDKIQNKFWRSGDSVVE